MHAIQTSGNCIRNISSDQYAGVAADEASTRAPGPSCCASGRASTPNSYLPRKFKIA
jgi:sulfite reductase (NADPH) hemoprotein beta-component